MGRISVYAAVGAAVFLLCGCHALFRGGSCNKPAAYAKAETDPSLKIPPGLTSPDTTKALKIPELNEPEPPPRSRNDPCLDEPPSFVVPKKKPQPAA